jgi:flavin-binding protein dodecin
MEYLNRPVFWRAVYENRTLHVYYDGDEWILMIDGYWWWNNTSDSMTPPATGWQAMSPYLEQVGGIPVLSGGGPCPVQYTLTYTAGANGSIVGTSPQTVNHGADGTLVTATPGTGYHFASWSDAYPTAARTDLGVTADVTAEATFAINQYTLTYTAGANGSIVGTSPQTVNHGADGTLVTATPGAGYHFVSWSDSYPTAARTETNVTASKSVTATFAINQYTLTYTAGANGSIVGTSPQTVNHGADGTLVTATPGTGYHFASWSDGVLTAARTDLNVTANVDVTANFAIDTFTLNYAAGANGALTGDVDQVVDYDTDGTLVTAVPATGYQFVDWSDGATQNPRTDLNVTANVNVTANFAIDLLVLPAYPATETNVWSFLTRPVPTTVDAGGNIVFLPVVYAFGELIEVRFELRDGEDLAIRDADVTLDLWKYTAEYDVGIGWQIMTCDIAYDRDAKAYTMVIPTDAPDFKLLPGFYEWRLMMGTDEELAVLRMIIE